MGARGLLVRLLTNPWSGVAVCLWACASAAWSDGWVGGFLLGVAMAGLALGRGREMS